MCLVELAERKLRSLAVGLRALGFACGLVNGLLRRSLDGHCLVYLVIARDAALRLRRRRMMHRAAHRTGRSVTQIRRKQPRTTRTLGLLQLLHLRQVLVVNNLCSFEPLDGLAMRLRSSLCGLLQLTAALRCLGGILLRPHGAFERGARFAERNVRTCKGLARRFRLHNRILRFALSRNQRLFLLKQGLHLLLGLLRRRDLCRKVFCARKRLTHGIHAQLRRIEGGLRLRLANVRAR